MLNNDNYHDIELSISVNFENLMSYLIHVEPDDLLSDVR